MILKLTKQSGGTTVLINTRAIDYVVAFGSNSEIMLSSGRSLVVLEPVDVILSKMPRGEVWN